MPRSKPLQFKKLREKRDQPCGQKLIFLLVAHCCRRANMPQENSTTHTPLFSSGFSQLYTRQQSLNWDWTRISMSAQKACAGSVQPDATLWPSGSSIFARFLDCDRGKENLSFPNAGIFVHFPVLLWATSASPSFSHFTPLSNSIKATPTRPPPNLCMPICFTALLYLSSHTPSVCLTVQSGLSIYLGGPPFGPKRPWGW